MRTPEELIEWLWSNSLIPICNTEECRDIISYLGAFEQIKWERDIAIGQLEELGYSLGEKIREDEK